MSTRYELEIILKARNQLAETFKAAKAAVSDLKGEVGGYGKEVGASVGASNASLISAKTAWIGVAAAVGTVATGAALAARAVYDLALRGSEVSGVKNSFDLLAVSAGGANKVLEAGRTGTRGLLTDYDLMLNANRLLGARLPITAQQFGELAGQAVILGRSVGKDAKDSVDRLSLALAKMEPELLDEINIKVSAVDANKKYADSLGVNVTQLTAYQRQIAFLNAVQEQARERTEALGGLQLTFADHVTIVKNRVKDMYDQLAVGVSLAPALGKLVGTLGTTLLNAFGSNQEAAIRNIVAWVDRFVIGLVDTASGAVSAAKFIGLAWLDLNVAFADVGATIVRLVEISAKLQAWQREQLASVPGLGKFYQQAAADTRRWATDLENLRVGFEANAKSGRESMAKWSEGTDGVQASLAKLRAEMVEASKQGVTQAAVTRAVAAATEAQGVEAGRTTGKTKEATAATAAMSNNLTIAAGRLSVVQGELVGVRTDLQQLVDVPITPVVVELAKLNAHLPVTAVTLAKAKQQSIEFAAGIDEATEAAQRMRDEIADRTARDIIGAFQSMAYGLGGIFGEIAHQWTGMLDSMIASSEAKNGKLWQWMSSSAGQKVSGGLQVGVQSFTQGYGLGSSLGKTGGALAGAGSGAAMGAMYGSVVPGLGTALGAGIGAIAGGIGGYFGGRKKDKEEKAAMQDLQQELLKTYGGMENLKKLAKELGVSIEGAFSAKKPKDALKVIDQFTLALDKQKKEIEGLGMAIEGLDLRNANAFGGQLASLVEQRVTLQAQANNLKTAIAQADAKGGSEAETLRAQYLKVQTELDQVQGKLTGVGATGQAEFERLGIYAAANLAGIIKQTGDVRGAFDAVGPTLDNLTLAQDTLGFASNETIDKMLGMREVVKANGPVLDNLAALTQMTKGWGDAGLMTRGLFQTVASDVGANLQQMIDGGVSVDQALALAGPTLQMLWEHQQKYGGIADETTQTLLEQAKAQGLVGDHQKTINQQMLDATLGLSAAVKDLAAFLRGDLPSAAADAARGIREKFDGLRFRVPVEFDDGGGYRGGDGGGSGGEYQGMASGGSVPWTPGGRLVRVAEAGTERIVSDAQLGAIIARAFAGMQGAGGQRGTIVIRNEIGGRVVNELVVDATNQGLRNGQVIVPAKAVREQVF